MLASFPGYIVGMGLLVMLAAGAFDTLRFLLGLSIIVCALLLWRSGKPYEEPSSPRTFAIMGGVSGILGGLFSSPGPPLVYVTYRQPWPLRAIQESLIFSFGVGTAFRLIVLGSTGQISMQSVLLGVTSLPVAFLVTAWAANRPPPCSRKILQHVVCTLLILSGAGMLV